MAQVMVNFRIDEEVKKEMEQACREMGLSMSAAFTIFAKKVGKEKRIPFEITAEYQSPAQRRAHDGSVKAEAEEAPAEHAQARLELLCAAVRRSLTAIHSAIPAKITGLSMEKIRLLCGDELKDKAAGITKSSRALFTGQSAEALKDKDLSLLDEYTDALSAIAQELADTERELIPAMKAWQGDGESAFAAYEQRLTAVSKQMDALSALMQRFLCSTSCGGAQAVRRRLKNAARPVTTAYVLTALESLDALISRQYDALNERTKARLEADYFRTLELTLRELCNAEQEDDDVSGKAVLCLRVINVLSQVIAENRQLWQEWREWTLEAEVAGLERLAAARGEISDAARPEA